MDYRLKTPILLAQLLEKASISDIMINDSLKKISVRITNVAPSSAIIQGSLSFSKTLVDNDLECTILIADNVELPKNSTKCTYIPCKNPRLAFIQALDYLDTNIGFKHLDFDSQVHPTVKIGQNVIIERGCKIAENVVIEHNVVIHKGTTIGKNSRIRANSSIGGDGFGFERLADGTPLRFTHLGGVEIGENVELGSLNSVARGTLSNTIIKNYVKTDNLVHIAHNCVIGEGVFITACAEFSGGVTVGKNAWIGPNSSIMQKISIGENALVGLGSVVTKSIEDNHIYAGNPAKFIRTH